ncbi:hypothetical protein EN858_29915 [Mesorhizobium sp. M4B.F.Ca.ET.215.01.1.1]|uniref:hypothetical protein n=1 Tax=unclassified Mesorhizobium TaxID=325217 RepID=UPI000FE8FDE1|nr:MULTISPECIES: hypothetical protein [unclassified Mesorhizobium]RWC82916.1 MAG: hypothetical protein EOS31_14255 [Mesorhizobium sp.]TGQ05231.1 hypothetical protein EN858_29915 [Mesorhizobium sp. M4B.F.Ca.ET.215.01.1.1]TGQ30536.1 hypothetical protein EN863_040765 [Mesorhizobium sp. M00.F.Ca.ET.220.01.1.1]TGQ97777.1 hypothetical protein EN846_28155 [Mesorhizobium sp. M4B.F.Ca.ET.203.01.1.1]TIV38411.1 MAG: hypothetical protein E5V91_14800 [Mesorhizobium sp.]
MPYSAEQIAEFHHSLDEWAARERALSEALISRAYRQERSQVMAVQGFTRRLHTLIRCIEQVYELVPPEAEKPSRQGINDAAIWLQAFVINVYGAVDNLARLWVWEADAKYKGKPIPSMYIGLTPDNTAIRESLSEAMQEHMSGTDAWFGYLENYRHALAHRIPLYIPSTRMDDEGAAEWRRLETESFEALKARNFNLYDELLGQQSELGVFEPWMMHAYGPDTDDGTPVRFHPQMICDLATVVEIGEKMLQELNSLPQEA